MLSRFQFFCQHLSSLPLLSSPEYFTVSSFHSVSRSFFSEVFPFSFFTLRSLYSQTSRRLSQPFVSHFVYLSLSLFFIDNHASPSPLFSLSVLPLDTFPLLVLFLNRGRAPRLSLSPPRKRHTSFTILPRHSVLLFIATSEDTVQNWLERRSSTRFGTVIDWPDCRATQPSSSTLFSSSLWSSFSFSTLLPFNFAKMESHKKRPQRVESATIESSHPPNQIAFGGNQLQTERLPFYLAKISTICCRWRFHSY